MDFIEFDNNMFLNPLPDGHIWKGKFSEAKTYGHIIKYIQKILLELNKNILFIIGICDGNITNKHISKYIQANSGNLSRSRHFLICSKNKR